ncbi:WRKY DNA-binding protein 28 [Striga asiatica]|uniref:WRKY DNA-binding protein 28 n=1 Tax=Striga asiatica TaxID=4170 RepID=A0A5A7QU88_STRAF|nr:WRKY DNA-binding protein 28 [Striga asiatica]
MSEELREFYYRHLFHDGHRQTSAATSTAAPFSGSLFPAATPPQPQTFDPNPYLSFSEILHGTSDHNKYILPETFAGGHKSSPEAATGGGGSGGELPATPNSSLSSSSAEAAGGFEDESSKGKKVGHQEDISKKEGKGKTKRGEKKEKQERFAFMTKSEVDHLEDGYRWRKYGQKAVKNSPYPRSYYRCTTQKCLVKKRVERSFQDPSIVVTTYEGKHNHHVPANLRGHVARMLAPSMFASSLETCGPSFPQELLLHQMPDYLYGYNNINGGSSNNLYHERTPAPHNPHQFQQFQDYGLLQDIIPPVFPKHEP